MSKLLTTGATELPAPGSVVLLPLAGQKFSAAVVIKATTGIDPTQSTARRTVSTTRVLVVTSAWVSDEPKLPSDSELRRWLFLTHHSWKSVLQAHWISEPLPPGMKSMGSIPITQEDLKLDSSSYGSSWESLGAQSLAQWRWDHDRSNLLAEEEREAQEVAERARLYMEKQAQILESTTLDSLSSRDWFSHWNDDWEQPLQQQAKAMMLNLLEDLLALQKTSKSQILSRVRQFVASLNQLNAEESLIQTTHSEDLIEALELIAIVTKTPTLIQRVDDWREW